MRSLRYLAVVILLLVVGCGGKELKTTMSIPVEDFTFTTQDNETLSLDDLKGKWWVADFIFTNCISVCPPMTYNMYQLQQKMKEENLNAQLISFTVDPDRDTPEVLKRYAEGYQADLSNWAFLTGYDFETIEKLSMESFQSFLARPPEGSDQVTHGTRFYLVNPEGIVVKSYNGVEPDGIEDIVNDLKKVL